MADLWADLEAKLATRKLEHLYRRRKLLSSAQGAKVLALAADDDNGIAGREVYNFCSNDYLGLAASAELVSALTISANRFGVGGGASHLVCGHSDEHHQLELEAAKFLGRDKALLFSTGYMANLGILSALCNERDVIIEDKLNHASMLDGAKLSGAKLLRFNHNDVAHLQSRLEKAKALEARFIVICVDGVFSMDGDVAPLKAIVELAKTYNAILMVDDAHGIGVLGKTGAGLCEHLGLSQDDVPILMVTLGKAVGSFGAIVAGSDLLIDALVQYARPYIYTTSMPPAVAAASNKALVLISQQAEKREYLAELIEFFKAGCKERGLPLMPSDTAIQPLLVGDEALALKWQQALEDKGFWISAIRTPTVAKGAARLRITLTAAHSNADVLALLKALADVNKVYPLDC
jgi:8-amino-7-oxononanoate synthase